MIFMTQVIKITVIECQSERGNLDSDEAPGGLLWGPEQSVQKLVQVLFFLNSCHLAVRRMSFINNSLL